MYGGLFCFPMNVGILEKSGKGNDIRCVDDILRGAQDDIRRGAADLELQADG